MCLKTTEQYLMQTHYPLHNNCPGKWTNWTILKGVVYLSNYGVVKTTSHKVLIKVHSKTILLSAKNRFPLHLFPILFHHEWGTFQRLKTLVYHLLHHTIPKICFPTKYTSLLCQVLFIIPKEVTQPWVNRQLFHLSRMIMKMGMFLRVKLFMRMFQWDQTKERNDLLK